MIVGFFKTVLILWFIAALLFICVVGIDSMFDLGGISFENGVWSFLLIAIIIFFWITSLFLMILIFINVIV